MRLVESVTLGANSPEAGATSVNINAAHAPDVIGDAGNLPFVDQAFKEVQLNHFPGDILNTDVRVLDEATPVLQTGGRISISSGKVLNTAQAANQLIELGYTNVESGINRGVTWVRGILGV